MHQQDPARPARVVGEDELSVADPTPGMTRRLAFRTDRTWTGTVETAPGVASPPCRTSSSSAALSHVPKTNPFIW